MKDQRIDGETAQNAAAPAPIVVAAVTPSHTAAMRPCSRFARAPRLPSSTTTGSCARNPETTARPRSTAGVLTPATANDVTSGKASWPYAPCSFGSSDILDQARRAASCRRSPIIVSDHAASEIYRKTRGMIIRRDSQEAQSARRDALSRTPAAARHLRPGAQCQ